MVVYIVMAHTEDGDNDHEDDEKHGVFKSLAAAKTKALSLMRSQPLSGGEDEEEIGSGDGDYEEETSRRNKSKKPKRKKTKTTTLPHGWSLDEDEKGEQFEWTCLRDYPLGHMTRIWIEEQTLQ